jgi:formate hydrogenlyase subunit 3/multisubunit Na+/H+ antiporter MnhD subunit
MSLSADAALSAAVFLPLSGALAVALMPRAGVALALSVCWANAALVLALHPLIGATTALGGWAAPLGIGLRLDGLAWPFLALTAAVMALTTSGAGARAFLGRPGAAALWLFLLSGLNALFLSADAFNLYVALEIVSLAAVAITALGGAAAAAAAPALRYLIVGLGGSLLYLAGVAVLYRATGALDLGLLAAAGLEGPALAAPLALATVGLLMKAGVAPFHFWLPPAHGAAAPAASAVLSGVVVKAALYLLLRLWTETAPAGALAAAEPAFRVLGVAALAAGALGAARATRLKTVIAYSTVLQVGYVVLALGFAAQTPLAVKAAVAFVIAHGLAKAGVFIAAGSFRAANGHDRIDELTDPGPRLGPAKAAAALGAVALMGLPPSGGFLAKWTLAEAALLRGHWWMAPLLVGGAILTSLKMVRVADGLIRPRPEGAPPPPADVPRGWGALALAAAAMAAGFAGPALHAMIVEAAP